MFKLSLQIRDDHWGATTLSLVT